MANPDNLDVNELRGYLGTAVRTGNKPLEEEVRHELLAKTVEARIVRQLTGQRTLSQEQVERICAAVRSFGPQPSRVAEDVDPIAV